MVRDGGGRRVEPEREELEVSGVELRLPMMLDMAMADRWVWRGGGTAVVVVGGSK